MRHLAAGLWLVSLAGTACERRPEGQAHAGDTPGPNQIVGVLRVTGTEAYIEHHGARIRLIEAPPQTASSHVALMAQAAAALGTLDGRRVRARGRLQNSILWDAEVTADGGVR
jgi:hypothetical protein